MCVCVCMCAEIYLALLQSIYKYVCLFMHVCVCKATVKIISNYMKIANSVSSKGCRAKQSMHDECERGREIVRRSRMTQKRGVIKLSPLEWMTSGATTTAKDATTNYKCGEILLNLPRVALPFCNVGKT